MKFGMSLRYKLTLGRFGFKFHKNQTDDDVIVTSYKFSPNIVLISKSIKLTNFVLGTNSQQHNVHLMIKMKMTLTVDEGHM